jgi:2-C-methyl-D-erythritol 4-phosphate cytidylyltransferase
MTYAILLAGGIGERLGTNPIKPLLLINKTPMFAHALRVLINNKYINKIVVVINPKYKNELKK